MSTIGLDIVCNVEEGEESEEGLKILCSIHRPAKLSSSWENVGGYNEGYVFQISKERVGAGMLVQEDLGHIVFDKNIDENTA